MHKNIISVLLALFLVIYIEILSKIINNLTNILKLYLVYLWYLLNYFVGIMQLICNTIITNKTVL